MKYIERIKLYKKLEEKRGNPLIVYVTSQRAGAQGGMGSDVIDEFIDQIEKVKDAEKKSVDLLIESTGGDGLTSWRIISLLRQRFEKVNVLVPHSAFSAATLLALGADEIIMGKYGSLGPIDPQITVKQKDGSIQQFGYEDITAFISFAKEEAGLTEQMYSKHAFEKLTDTVDPAVIGFAKRSSSLSTSIGERLLQQHMEDKTQAKNIAEKLNKSFFNHGHALTRKEAKEIGLNIVEADSETEKTMWDIHKSFEREINTRVPFNVVSEFLKNPGATEYLKPPAPVVLPENVNQQMLMNAIFQSIQQQLTQSTPDVTKELKIAFLESIYLSSQFNVKAKILVQRTPDLQFRGKMIELEKGWVQEEVSAESTEKESKDE